jgi:L-ascorbate metabolism protein UlaG (beta-lactamase superfamily)
VVPIGAARVLLQEGIAPVHELDWGESLSLPGLAIHSVPAAHFSGRGLFDRNRTLWCGYMIECPERLIYFAGDTGFGPHFAAIRERFGSPHLALLPVGAYEPRWFMSPIHMAPDEAVRAHKILAARTSIAIHHGTFQLADEGIDTARQQLFANAQHEQFLVINNGEFAEIP